MASKTRVEIVAAPPEDAALGDLIILLPADGSAEEWYYWRGFDGSLAMGGPFADAEAAWRAGRVWMGQQLALKG
ncbi:MAG: hypothetical protein ACYC5O_12065 [Anaerolineae bacterium]